MDSSEVDAALSAKLLGDATLMALATDGVFFDEATQNATKFVIISLVDEHDTGMFQGRAYEEALYLVKYVEQGTGATGAKAAAARIDALLNPQPPSPPATLTITGYSLMAMRRESRVRYTEVDDLDQSIRWQHRGGRYTVMVSPS